MIFTITTQCRSIGMITHSVVRTVWTQRYTPQKEKSGHYFIYLEDYIIQRQMNNQSGFNAEQIEKNKYPESITVWRINLITSKHSKTKTVWLINQQVMIKEDYTSLKVSTLFKNLRLVFSIQTNHACHITSTQLRDYFLSIRFFSSLSPCWFFIHGGKCRKPPRYVPYKCTYVPYDGTFGASNQGH